MLCAICDKPLDPNEAQRIVHPVYCKLVQVCPDGRICKSKYDSVVVEPPVRKPKDKTHGLAKHLNRQRFYAGGS